MSTGSDDEVMKDEEQEVKRIKMSDDFDFDYWFKAKTLEPKYIYEDDLIRVDPYFFIYQCYAKGRWMNKSIYHVFTTEFQDQSTEYYELAILEGRIRVNECQVSSEYKIKSMDRIQHLIHRHEPPVNRFPEIEYVYEDKELLIVNKPSSLPVHPSGRYSHNTLIEMIKHKKKITKLYPSNRLDRLTSGIVIIGLNEVIAKKIESEMKSNKVSKEYFCRVSGKFPESAECDQPIKVLNHKLGLNTVHPDGKPSFTRFELVKFNGKSSLVKAIPKTGRTHQIRVHLFYLGFPITNDPLYKLSKDSEENNSEENNSKDKDGKENVEGKLNGINSKEKEVGTEKIRGIEKSEGDNEVELIDGKINKVTENNIKEKKKEKQKRNEAGQEIPKVEDENNETELDQNKIEDKVLLKVNNTSNLNLIKIQYMNEHTIELAKKRMQPSKINSVGWTQCDVCNNLIPPDPIIKDNLIYLHAYSYKLLDHHFITKNLPDWAKEDYED